MAAPRRLAHFTRAGLRRLRMTAGCSPPPSTRTHALADALPPCPALPPCLTRHPACPAALPCAGRRACCCWARCAPPACTLVYTSAHGPIVPLVAWNCLKLWGQPWPRYTCSKALVPLLPAPPALCFWCFVDSCLQASIQVPPPASPQHCSSFTDGVMDRFVVE